MISIIKIFQSETEKKSECEYEDACIITNMNGDITIEKDCILEGNSSGKMNIKGKLLVKPSGKFIGTVIANEIILKGHLEGTILCKTNVRCTSSATIIGKISSNTFDLDENITFEGVIDQIKPSEFDKKVNDLNLDLVNNIPKKQPENFEINNRVDTLFYSKPNMASEKLNLKEFPQTNKISANPKKVVEKVVEKVDSDSSLRKSWF